MYRKTYALINKENIEYNIKNIINKYNYYKYYIGVVKADCYSHGNVISSIIKSGCNYLATATLDEALEIRKNFKDIPILCLGIIDINDIEIAKTNNITITISSLEYALKIKDIKDLKIHVKINTGMNRLGINSRDEFDKIYNLLNIEGVYSHIYNGDNYNDTIKQFDKFKNIIKNKDIEIIHIQASNSLKYGKLDFVNGARLGIIMYGFNNDLKLKSTFQLHSTVIEIQRLKKGDTLGYNAIYKALDNEKIAIIAIGYADGIIRKNVGRYVYINNKKYYIVGICMDMLFAKVDESINIGDDVILLKDNNHINYVAKHLDTISYEVLCQISKRVPRI